MSSDEDDVSWLERDFKEQEIKVAVFKLGGHKASVPYGFLLVFFQRFWEDTKEDILAFMKEFYSRGKLSRHIEATFITLITKNLELNVSRIFALLVSLARFIKS